MVKEAKDSSVSTTHRCLIVGNYCHDVLIKDDVVIAESLGGAASFISAVLDGLSVSSNYISKVGPDFVYSVNHRPITSSSSKTTVFHAYFSTESTRQDRILKRVTACDPVTPSDLPNSKFDFGLAVGVGGEILPETLERMIEMCKVVFVDIQALIRVFDPVDGTVNLVHLNQTGFWPLLNRIGYLKASEDEAPFVDVEEARKWCCVVVTKGKDGCTVYSKDEELSIAPFPAYQVDPTGAGDSFLGGLVAGLVDGLAVPDAALLGNFFGSLTVGQIGLPKFDSRMVQLLPFGCAQGILCFCAIARKPIGEVTRTAQSRCDELDPEGKPLAFAARGFELETSNMEVPSPNHIRKKVKDEVLKRSLQHFGSHEKHEDEPKRLKPLDHEEFLAALSAAKVVPSYPIKECKWDLHSSPEALEQPACNGHRRLPLNPVCEEPIKSVDSKP